VYELVEAMFPSAQKVDLFARRQRSGFDVWGLEAGPEA
jgi:N6-adenosine-specific RNA methylase IME4